MSSCVGVRARVCRSAWVCVLLCFFCVRVGVHISVSKPPFVPMCVARFLFYISTRSFHLGSPADGILYPGDQVVQINDKMLEDVSAEQVENILR